MSKDLEQRLHQLESQLASLTRRVYELESGHAAPVFTPPPQPTPEASPIEEPIPVEAPLAPTDWESNIGGNWLNRAGILLLSIGITLFLGYAMTWLGPAGKIAIGALSGAALLGAGYHFEQRQNFRPFSLGLLAGGFAVLYITAYAAHAVEASRIIANPYLGATIQTAVAIAAIFAATRLASEKATSLAFLAAYIGLYNAPSLPVVLIGLYPLTLGGLWLSHHLGWRNLPWALLLYTWVAQLNNTERDWDIQLLGRPLAWVNLALFASFEIFWRRASYSPANPLWILANALAFLLATFLDTRHDSDAHTAGIFGLLTLAGLTTSTLRDRLNLRHEAVSEALTLVAASWWIVTRYSKSDPLLLLMLVLAVTLLGLWRNASARTFVCTITGETLLLLVTVVTFLTFPESKLLASAPLRIHLALPQMAILIAALFLAGRLFTTTPWPSWAALTGVAILTLTTIPKTAGTIVLALEAILALAAGLYLQRRPIRLGGLALFLFSIGKVFLYDLSELDTLPRIFSFIILGLLLIAASWAYTRYRKQLQEYL